MTEWRYAMLGDVIELKRGYDLPAAMRRPGNIPIVSSSGRSGYHDEAKVRGPGVVTGRYGTLGNVYFIEEDFWPLNTALYVRDFKGNDPRFTAGLLESLELRASDVAAAVPGVNRNHLHRLPVRIPNLAIQRKISWILGGLDEFIENNLRRIELLEQMVQSIYREWFMYFRYPGHEKDELVDSPRGPFPEGWSVHRLGELAAVVRGRSYRKHELVTAGGVPFINLKCVERGGGFRRSGLKRYNGPYKSEQVVQAGDIVLAVTDLTQNREILARATLVPRLSDERGVISLDVVRLVPGDPLDRLPLFASLRYTDFPDRVKEYANGSTVLHLAPTHLSDAQVEWAPRHLRRQFSETVGPIFASTDELHDAVDRLRQLRDLLLPRLITGWIDVSKLDLDAVLEGAVG
jgi:type I restriction enzyme, S subunit